MNDIDGLKAGLLRAFSARRDLVEVSLANIGQCARIAGLENQIGGADEWVKIAPYGESLKERMARNGSGRLERQVFVQQLDRASAEELASRFNGKQQGGRRFAMGVPIYKGHPDLSTHSPETVSGEWGDARPCGMIKALEAREDGLYGQVVVTDEGEAAIENGGLKWMSPFWNAVVIGIRDGGARIARPFKLISVGLTRNPNISGGEALANAVASAPENPSATTKKPNQRKREQSMKAKQRYDQLIDEQIRPGRDHCQACEIVGQRHPDLETLVCAVMRPAVPVRKSALANQATPEMARAGEQLADASHDYMRAHPGVSYATAYMEAEKANPALANSAGMAWAVQEQTRPPISGPEAALFGLRPGEDQKIFNAAWEANGKTMSPINPGKIFEAVAAAIAEEEGIEIEQAIRRAKERAPNLWKMVQAQAK